jgi:hypothetical protein
VGDGESIVGMDKGDWEFAISMAAAVFSLAIALLGLDWKLVSGRLQMPHLNIRNLIILALIFGSLVFSGIGWYQYSHSGFRFDENAKLEEVSFKTFRNETVPIDGKSFHNCTFINVTFEYDGRSTIAFSNNTMVGAIGVKSINPSIFGGWILVKGLGLTRDFPVFGPNGQILPNIQNPELKEDSPPATRPQTQ